MLLFRFGKVRFIPYLHILRSKGGMNQHDIRMQFAISVQRYQCLVVARFLPYAGIEIL